MPGLSRAQRTAFRPAAAAGFISASLAAALVAPAQVTTGSISGYVLDPSSRPIGNAGLVASSTRHSHFRSASTDALGLYRFLNLPPGIYRVSAHASGFEQVAVAAVTVAVDSHLRLDFRLPLAGRADSVQVSASVQAVHAESAELGAVLDRRQVETLPLNRRDFLQLALLAPGVVAPAEDSQLSQYGSFAMHANGGREEFNNYLLDGIDNNDPYVNRYVVQPPLDGIQEFKIATNSYSAEYGRSAAGQVNVVTRSGGNEFHGALYEYLRNQALDRRNFFDGASKAELTRNQFGAAAGGPLVRNHLFTFLTADFLRERRGFSRLANVPSAAAREGDFSGASKPLLDPFTRQPFPGNRIPGHRISPIASRILDLFPVANRPGVAGNYLAQPVLREAQSQVSARADAHPSDADQVTLRYTFSFLDLFEPYSEEGDAVPGFGDFVRDSAHHATVQHQRAFGPRATHSLRLGFVRFSREILPENHGVDVGRQWGVDWLRLPPRSLGFPAINVSGLSRLGDTTLLPIFRHTNTYQAAEGIAAVFGAHLLKAGVDVHHQRLNAMLDLLSRGSLSFSGALSGYGVADLLLGLPSFGLQARSDNPITMRTTQYAGYAQDDWKLTPNLTWNLGVRYEYSTPPVDPADRMSALDLATGQVVRVGTGGVPRSGTRPDRNNFAPRAGLVWSPERDLLLRAGYGIFYDSGMFIVNSAQYFNPPQFNLRVFFPTATSLLTLENAFPAGGGLMPPASLNTLSPEFVGAYLQHWSASLEGNLRPGGSYSLAYAGSKGTHLVRSRDLNQPRPAPGDVQPRRPLPRYGGILLIESGSASSYHSLQATMEVPLGRSASVRGAYTFSKSIDDTSAFLSVKADKNFPQDSRNFRAERALSSFDVRHRAVVAGTFPLPRTTRWTRDTELRGIAVVQSGYPFTPVLRFDNSNTGNTGGAFGLDRPDLLRNPVLNDAGPEAWFDTAAFRVPAKYTFGSAGRNILRAPGTICVDAALARQFRFGDGPSLSLEAHAFNLLNRANFNLPEMYADDAATFSRIFSAKAPRQIQFAVRFSF